MNHLWDNISLHEIIMTLEDLIEYFAPPGNDIGGWRGGVVWCGVVWCNVVWCSVVVWCGVVVV